MKRITIEITMDIEDTDCLDIESIGEDLIPAFDSYGDFINIKYKEN